MNPFSAWLFTILLAIAPPDKRDEYQRQLLQPSISPAMQARAGLPEARETAEEGRTRYQEIARDLDAVLATEKPLFGGKNGKIWTAAVMLAFMKLESGFRLDVDKGIGKWGRGDLGRSHCMLQLQLSGKNGEGHVQIAHPEMGTWTGSDVTSDRRKCFRAGLEILRRSIGACQTGMNAAGEIVPLKMADRFSGYTTGTCKLNEDKSRVRWAYAAKLYGQYMPAAPPPQVAPNHIAPDVPALPVPPPSVAPLLSQSSVKLYGYRTNRPHIRKTDGHLTRR